MATFTRTEIIEAGYEIIGTTNSGADIAVYRSDSRTTYNPQREHFRFIRIGGLTVKGDREQASDWAMPDAYPENGELYDAKDNKPQAYTMSWGSRGFDFKDPAESLAFAEETADMFRIIAGFLKKVNRDNAREWSRCRDQWLARKQEWAAAEKVVAQQDTAAYLATKHSIVLQPGETLAIEETINDTSLGFKLYEGTIHGACTFRDAPTVKAAREFVKSGEHGGYLVRSTTSRLQPATAKA